MKYIILPLFAALAFCGNSDFIYWAPHKCEDSKPTDTKMSRHGKGGMLYLANGEDKNISVLYHLPNLTQQEGALKKGVITPKINMGGYYALSAAYSDTNSSNFAIRYLSANGKPVDISPSKLTNTPKNILEIIPEPLPREHDRYTATKEYMFRVVYDNKPFSGAELYFEGANGVRSAFLANQNGVARIVLPNDFSNVQPDKKQSGEFILFVARGDKDNLATSTFSAPYYPDPNDWYQSQTLGFGGVLLGFLGGLFLYHRVKKGVK